MLLCTWICSNLGHVVFAWLAPYSGARPTIKIHNFHTRDCCGSSMFDVLVGSNPADSDMDGSD